MLDAKLFLEGEIEVLTGLHIGGSRETLDIGGIDNPVIKLKQGEKEIVYIPGSSLKGKIRSLLERVDGKIGDDGGPCACGDCDICKLFGPHSSKNIKEPHRVIVRDSYLEEEIELEEKTENMVDRLKGTASNPRQTERVPKGTKFKFEIIFSLYSKKDRELVKKFVEGMKLLEDDYLGGSGSRGYGKIRFRNMKLICKTKKYYEGEENEETKQEIPNIENLTNLTDRINEIKYFNNG